jgi:DNA-binding transcriptional regulator/RsmH inhibitor MraZ
MNESETAINVEQKSRIILPAEKKDMFAKQDKNRE